MMHRIRNMCFLLAYSVLYPGPAFTPASAAGLAGDTLRFFYSVSRCGLNFTEASVLLGKKMKPYGMPYDGVDQPAPLTISGIPSGAQIERAIVWWDLTRVDTVEKVILENPSGTKDTFPGELISYTSGGCWSIGATAFRTDVTSIITGNGTYLISGLPVDSTLATYLDVNGATLLIIYSDPSADFSGSIMIYDGYTNIKTDTFSQQLNGLSVLSNSSYAEGFIIVSDMENLSGNAMKMNNGPYQSITADYWDFESRNTIVLAGQTTSAFGVRAPLDCCNLIMMGLYYQQPADTAPPIITRSNDTLSCNGASGYQWFLNGIQISGATQQQYLVTQPGIYSVVATNASGCLMLSDTFFVICLTQYNAPIYHNGPQFWTDNNFSTFQWYFGTALIAGATTYQYTAPDTGYYSVKVVDTLGCTYYSDSVYTDLTDITTYNQWIKEINIYPNPASEKLTVEFINTDEAVCELKIFNIAGKIILVREIPCSKNMTLTYSLDISSFENAVYFMQISENKRAVYRGKILKYIKGD